MAGWRPPGGTCWWAFWRTRAIRVWWHTSFDIVRRWTRWRWSSTLAGGAPRGGALPVAVAQPLVVVHHAAAVSQVVPTRQRFPRWWFAGGGAPRGGAPRRWCTTRWSANARRWGTTRRRLSWWRPTTRWCFPCRWVPRWHFPCAGGGPRGTFASLAPFSPPPGNLRLHLLGDGSTGASFITGRGGGPRGWLACYSTVLCTGAILVCPRLAAVAAPQRLVPLFGSAGLLVGRERGRQAAVAFLTEFAPVKGAAETGAA